MSDLDPLAAARADAEKFVVRVRHRAEDVYKTHATAALLKPLLLAAVAIVAAVLNFPVVAFALVALALGTLVVYAIYATRLLKRQDRDARWTYLGGKRVQQDVLDARIAMDTVTLALMGERHAPGAMRSASPELRGALHHHQHRLHRAEQRAEAAEAVKDGTASDTQRCTLKSLQRGRWPEPPKGPAVEPIKARRLALVAEREALAAEIKSLSTAESISKAMLAEEVQGARRTVRERQDDARKADQAARDRVRAGKEPTRREPEHVITMQVAANGEREVGQGRGPATPEQIAKGESVA